MSLPDEFSTPTVEAEVRRNPAGWIVLGLVLSLLIFSELASSTNKTAHLYDHDEQQDLLRTALKSERPTTGTVKTDPQHKADALAAQKDLDPEIVKLESQIGTDRMAARLYAAMSFERHRPVPARNLAILAKSKQPSDSAMYEIYTAPSLSRQRALTLVGMLPDTPFVYTAAKVQALEKAGDKDALQQYVPVVSNGQSFFGAFITCLFGASFATWVVLWQRYKQGTLNPLGIPMESISPGVADGMAMRAAQIIVLFTVIGVIVELSLFPKAGFGVQSLATGLLLIVGILVLQMVPIGGQRLTLARLGVTKENLVPNIFLGVQGFLAEFPVSLILALVGAAIFSWLPRASHPASQALENSHDLRSVVPLVLFGSVLVPFWEEIAFRGLIFPALNRVCGGMIPGIALSSAFFALVHPQGPSLWLSLAGIGATSCLLSYQSRSLVPSMVMHCLHNATVFAMALMMS